MFLPPDPKQSAYPSATSGACGSGPLLIESYRSLASNNVDRGAAEYSDVLEIFDRIAGNDLHTFSAVLAQVQLLWLTPGLKTEIKTQGVPCRAGHRAWTA
jgi:hypothetical protein